ncbi:MAG: HDIG domain-containing protein [Thaumarchaeota archaeon]|nr:HDIG domain-containing protein [Nitrososphaerota archaeon]
MIQKSRGEILSTFPEVERIGDGDLRDRVVKVWIRALEKSAWDDINRIPMSPGGPEKLEGFSLVDHTRCVTRTAMDLARNLVEIHHLSIDMDSVIAGAVLHDVGKPMLGRREGDRVVISDEGRKLTHIMLGSALAMEEGLPLDIVHIIFAHTVPYVTAKQSVPPQTIEGVIVHYADFGSGDPIFFVGKVALLCNPLAPMWSNVP